MTYSRFYLGRKQGLVSPDQGVRVVGIDLTGVLSQDKPAHKPHIPGMPHVGGVIVGRGCHSSTPQLNMSRSDHRNPLKPPRVYLKKCSRQAKSRQVGRGTHSSTSQLNLSRLSL